MGYQIGRLSEPGLMMELNKEKPPSVTTIQQKLLLLLFGFLVSLSILEVGMRICGGLLMRRQAYAILKHSGDAADLTILCLGESTTAYGDESSYPSQLENILNGQNLPHKIRVVNMGIPGATTTDIVGHIAENIVMYKPDIVVTMMGINDEYLGDIPYENTPQFKLVKFFMSFRVIKLAKLVYTRIVNFMRSDKPYMILGNIYYRLSFIHLHMLYFRSAAMYNKALERNPVNFGAFGRLEKLHKLLYGSDPPVTKANRFYYIVAGRSYRDQGMYADAVAVFEKVAALDPQDSWAYFELGGCYRYLKEYGKSEAAYKKGIALDPLNHWLYRGLAQCYLAQGKSRLAEECYKKSEEISMARYVPLTETNYNILKDIVFKRGIKLVCVQYPVRSIQPLKQLLGGDKRIVFVDNEAVFKNALRTSKYNELFSDSFGGDFGHCTAAGNRILAENVADAIVAGKVLN